MSDYGARAATAINTLLPGQHRAKTLQRLFNVSERTAKYLLAGQHWTLERLTQAGKAIQGFDELIATPVIHSRLDALEAELRDIRRHLRGEGGNDELRAAVDRVPAVSDRIGNRVAGEEDRATEAIAEFQRRKRRA